MSKSISDLIREALNSDDPTQWFEKVYARASEGDQKPPWAYMQAAPDLAEWAERVSLSGEGKKAIVVGCGMGDDAAFLADRGFTVTAFDISPTAIEICQKRFADKDNLHFQPADLLNTPAEWQGAFDFVLENRTVQSIPTQMASDSIGAIASFVAPDGNLLVLCKGRDPAEPARGIPWGLSITELQGFLNAGLTQQQFDDKKSGDARRFRVLYHRPTT